MADKTEKTAEEVIKELDAKIVAQNKTIAEKDKEIAEAKKTIAQNEKAITNANHEIVARDKALEEANSAIIELTEQLNQKKDVQPGAKTVSIKGKKYPLLLQEVRHNGKIVKYEDFVADEKLAKEVLDMDAGVFGSAL